MAEENVAPQPGTPEYEQAMAAKVDANAQAALDAANGGELKAPQEAPTEAPKEEPKEAEKAPEEKPVEAELEKKGIDYTALQDEFSKDGKLSDASYETLEKAGIPKNMVDAYIAGQEALQGQREARAIEAAGGQQQFEQMRDWAKTGMTKAEIEAFNTSVNGSEAEALQAITALRSRYESAYGKQPKYLGGTPANGNATGYGSPQEMSADMRDTRYSRDPAFRAKVLARVAATTAF